MLCSGGGIGIRATLKMLSAKADAGSIPAPSTGIGSFDKRIVSARSSAGRADPS